MAEEDKKKGRQLKIRGAGEDEDVQLDKKGKKKEEEKGGKWGVIIVLVATILVSIVFSFKSERSWFKEIFGKKNTGGGVSIKRETTPKQSESEGSGIKMPSGGGLFAPKVYEFE